MMILPLPFSIVLPGTAAVRQEEKPSFQIGVDYRIPVFFGEVDQRVGAADDAGDC